MITSVPELPAKIAEIKPEQLSAVLPRLGECEHDDEPIAILKFFTPDSSWTWYVQEFDGQDILYGLVHGFELEYGCFSLSELREVEGPFGLGIERDIHFRPCVMEEVYQWCKFGGIF